VQVVAVLVQLILQRLAPDAQFLPTQALLLQLPPQQLRLLFGLGTAFLGIAQFAIGVFQRQTRMLELVLDAHAPLQQLFELHAQLFQRCLTLLQVQRQLLAALDGAFELLFQPLQSLASRLVLRPERTDPQCQLMGLVLMLPRLLANTIEPLTDAVAAGQQRLALFGILRHCFQRFLQLQARFAQLFGLDLALLLLLSQLLVQPTTAQRQLFQACLAGRQPGLEVAMLACFFLLLTTLLFALAFQTGLLAAQHGDAVLHRRQARFALVTLGQQALQLLTARQYAGLCLARATHTQKMPADPIAIAADHTLALDQRRTRGQCLLQRFDRPHAAQP